MGAVISAETSAGFKCEVDSDTFDDIELLDLGNRIDEGHQQLLPKFIEKILGREQKKALYEHYRTEDGRVPVTVISQVMFEEIVPQIIKKNRQS